jgi:hypothetical protein
VTWHVTLTVNCDSCKNRLVLQTVNWKMTVDSPSVLHMVEEMDV